MTDEKLNKCNRKFSLEDVLKESPDWINAISDNIWNKRIKSSISWKQLVNLNERVGSLESNLAKMDSKLDLILINGGSK